MTDHITGPGVTPRGAWLRVTVVIIGTLVPIALVAIAGSRVADRAERSWATAAIHTPLAPGDAANSTASAPTNTQVAPLVVPLPPSTHPAPSTAAQVVVLGRVTVGDGGRVAGVVVGFQHPDCVGCARYTATTNTAGGYRLRLPEGRYRASCAPSGIRAYCLPVGAGFDVTLDQPVTDIDFEIAIMSSGRDGVGSRPRPPCRRRPDLPMT